ncbi:MAG TPA: fibronectin type III domain-containing protein, partial [Bacteroidota bacterium]|nr:fibronectin type III domain-containing protein [Bacteroidota bacterium]
MTRIARWILLSAGMFLIHSASLAQVGKILLDSPVNGATNQVVSPMLTWWTDAVARYYRIELSGDSTFASTRLDTTIAADTTQQKQSLSVGPLSNDSAYYWRVNGNTVKTGGTPGPWSNTFHFRTIPSQPSAPTLLAPASGSQNLPLIDTLKWNAVAIADAYRIQVSTSSSFSPMLIDSLQAQASGQQTQTFLLSGLTNAATYYWRVYSRNAAGQSTNPSSVWSFTTIVAVPSAPTLISPAASATSQDTANQTLTWGATAPASTTYRLQIATDSLFGTLAVDDSTISTLSKTLSPPLKTNASYSWRVRGKNAGGIGPYSIVRNFSTVLRPPTPVNPASGATNTAVSLVLDWSSVPGASTYRVQVGTSTSFSTFVVNTVTSADSLAVS